MNIAICAIAKNENQYLDEWINHYLELGIDQIIIYDNNSTIPIEISNKKVKVVKWTDDKFYSQSRAYLDCCRNNQEFDFIGFFDIDEFYQSKLSGNIKLDFKMLQDKIGDFDALGVYWRIYGSNPAYLERHSEKEYTQWWDNSHIKSFVNPKKVIDFPDPHKARINGRYINELGQDIYSPLGEHTSKYIWIKHIFTRSLSEFQEKMERGDANTREKNRTLNDFIQYNLKCVNND
jgi:hypothetical protein